MLQLSYSLNPEAPQGIYKIFVWINETKISLDFKVEKYGTYILLRFYKMFMITFNLKIPPFLQFCQNLKSK